MTALKHQTIVLDDGHRVGVTTGGSGTPLVLFHGFTANRRLYAPIMLRLIRRGFRVYAMDMAGHGDTDGLASGHSFADMVNLAVRALDVLDVGRAVMVGHSLGGRMVTELAARHPERVRHAVLINAAVGDDFDDLHVSARVAAKTLGALAGAVVDILSDVPWSSPRRALRYLRHLSGGGAPVSLSGIFNVAMATKSPKPPTVAMLAAMRRQKVSVTVIHCRHDRITHYYNGVQAALVTDGLLVTLPGAHNWIMVHPHHTAEVIAAAVKLAEEAAA
ncbi:hydrolase [Mycobacterium phage Milly]|uniref:esterase/lipase n=1 Tax=Mycobacterium phage Milly TaxID=1567473 RepID=UPI000572AAB0|nr:esterase/lipase [Mycobacterium phage Milly]AJA43734.1 hydrolase [Mycobacterium phage Milly]